MVEGVGRPWWPARPRAAHRRCARMAKMWPRQWDGVVAQCRLVGASSLARLVAGRDALPCGAAALLAGQE